MRALATATYPTVDPSAAATAVSPFAGPSDWRDHARHCATVLAIGCVLIVVGGLGGWLHARSLASELQRDLAELAHLQEPLEATGPARIAPASAADHAFAMPRPGGSDPLGVGTTGLGTGAPATPPLTDSVDVQGGADSAAVSADDGPTAVLHAALSDAWASVREAAAAPASSPATRGHILRIERSATAREPSAAAGSATASDARLARGNRLAAAGRWDEARAAYAAALREAPHRPDYHHNLGVALDRLGYRHAARHHYRRALGLATDFPATFGVAPLQTRLQELE